LVEQAYSQGVWGLVVKENPENVLGRYLRAANWSGAQIVTRITGDCPLIDPQIVDICCSAYIEKRVDIVSTVLRRTLPRGLDVEVTYKNVLKRIFHLTDDPRYREHVTLFAYENPSLFRFEPIYDNEDNSRFNVSVDTEKDLDRVRKIMLDKGLECNYLDVIGWCKENE
jgi:spore coat polysaccharide biosynthesis protein SpsF